MSLKNKIFKQDLKDAFFIIQTPIFLWLCFFFLLILLPIKFLPGFSLVVNMESLENWKRISVSYSIVTAILILSWRISSFVLDLAKWSGEKNNIRNSYAEKINVLQKIIKLMLFQYNIDNHFKNEDLIKNIQSLVIDYQNYNCNKILKKEVDYLDSILDVINLILGGQQNKVTIKYLRSREKILKRMYFEIHN